MHFWVGTSVQIFCKKKHPQTIIHWCDTVYLGSIFSMFINVNNPALHVRNSLAVLLVCCLQHCAAARIKGWTALGLHLGGEGGLVSCLALDVVNLHHSQLEKQLRSDVTSHLCTVLGITRNLLHHAHMDILGITEPPTSLNILTKHLTTTP